MKSFYNKKTPKNKKFKKIKKKNPEKEVVSLSLSLSLSHVCVCVCVCVGEQELANQESVLKSSPRIFPLISFFTPSHIQHSFSYILKATCKLFFLAFTTLNFQFFLDSSLTWKI